MSEKADEWRKRAIFWLIVRLVLGLIQIVGAITAIWLLVAAGVGWPSCGAIVITLFFTLLKSLLFSRRPARQRPATANHENQSLAHLHR
ncbi:MAG: hypothetical protein H0X34_17735 [Chthoniobacterales bacterium]|jgi:hypothetical protein|nr:hypothetical protein [Chthoniobacterales bacterium]